MQKFDGQITMPMKGRQLSTSEMADIEGGAWPAVASFVAGVIVASWDSDGKVWRIIKRGASKAKYKKKGKKWELVRVIH